MTHILFIEPDHDDGGLNYRVIYSDGEEVLLHCAEDVSHYLTCDEKGISPN